MRRFRVLVVDDEPRIVRLLKVRLEASGYQVLTAGSGPEALDQIQTQRLDLLILDVMMPGMDGFEALRQVRATSPVPAIMLSGRDASRDKVKGLELGADDYVAKPFDPDELEARIESIRRRLGAEAGGEEESITVGDITLDFKKRRVIVRGEEVPLTRAEWLLLSELARNAGKVMPHDELLTSLWGPEYRDDVTILRSWISRLRKKIERDHSRPRIIRTVARMGYMVDQPAGDEADG